MPICKVVMLWSKMGFIRSEFCNFRLFFGKKWTNPVLNWLYVELQIQAVLCLHDSLTLQHGFLNNTVFLNWKSALFFLNSTVFGQSFQKYFRISFLFYLFKSILMLWKMKSQTDCLYLYKKGCKRQNKQHKSLLDNNQIRGGVAKWSMYKPKTI